MNRCDATLSNDAPRFFAVTGLDMYTSPPRKEGGREITMGQPIEE